MLRITAVPALHGPAGTEHLTGPVTGFVVAADDVPAVYVSGDNASLELVGEIAERFPAIELAIVFAGAAQTPLLGDAHLTLTSEETVDVARLMPRARILPVHCDSWSHFTEGKAAIINAFAHADRLHRLVHVARGEEYVFAPQLHGSSRRASALLFFMHRSPPRREKRPCQRKRPSQPFSTSPSL